MIWLILHILFYLLIYGVGASMAYQIGNIYNQLTNDYWFDGSAGFFLVFFWPLGLPICAGLALNSKLGDLSNSRIRRYKDHKALKEHAAYEANIEFEQLKKTALKELEDRDHRFQ